MPFQYIRSSRHRAGFTRPASLSFLTPGQQSGAITLTEFLMSYAQIGGQALLRADHRKGEDPFARFVVFGAREASAGVKVTARNSWLQIWVDTWTLGFEASSVIGLRAVRMAGGGAAATIEAHRMVSEKIEASLALQGKALNGGLGITALSAAANTLEHYREKVRANQTRLARSSWLDERGDEMKNWPDEQWSGSAAGHARL